MLDFDALKAAIISSFDPIFAITPSFITSNLSTNARIDVRWVIIMIVRPDSFIRLKVVNKSRSP